MRSVGQRFFREELADSLGQLDAVGITAPAIVMPGSLIHAQGDRQTRAGDVQVYGVDDRIWSLMHAPGTSVPSGNDIVLNRKLAEQLQAQPGDTVSLLIEIPAALPRDSLLGDRNETVAELTLTVASIAEDDTTPGRFGLNPSQQLPANVFVALDTLQQQLGLAHQPVSRRNPTEKPARVNALFVSGSPAVEGNADWLLKMNADMVTSELAEHITLADLSLRLVTDDERGIVSLQSDQMILDPAVVEAASDAVVQMEDFNSSARVIRSPVLVYLINELWNPEDPDRYAMYSIAAGISPDRVSPFGPFTYVAGGPPSESPPAGRGQAILVVINDWLAEDLGVTAGDEIRAKYQQVGDRGELPEQEVTFVVSGVVKLEGAAADPGMTPHVEGITDAETFGDWRQPFPMDLARVTPRDEEYWDQHRTTPKVFMDLGQAQELWRSRYGELTSFRIAPPAGITLSDLADAFEQQLLDQLTLRTPQTPKLRMRPGTWPVDATIPIAGLAFQPVKWQGLSAAQGTTDFTGLFIGFSFFLIAAAVLLIGLLFRLGIERRVAELGLLGAVGLSPKQVRRLFLAEGGLIVLLGGLLGSLAAVAYAALMIYGLKTWWFGAMGTRFLFLSVRPASVVAGFMIAALVAMLAIWWALRQMRGVASRDLLAGSTSPPLSAAAQRRRGQVAGTAALIGFAIAGVLLLCSLLGLIPSVEAFGGFNWRVVSFFIIGISALTGSLTALSWWLDTDTTRAVSGRGPAAMVRLGLRNAARHRGRSVLTASLIAAATFVIVAVAAGRRNPAVEQPVPASGNGGFTLVAEAATPVLYDLNTLTGRAAAGIEVSGDAVEKRLLDQMHVASIRVRPGEDASCLNLYQTQLPTILGVPQDVTDDFIAKGRFRFADTPAAQPWSLLNEKLPSGHVPVLGDMNTLMYSLHKGIGQTIDADANEGLPQSLEVVGMLDSSIFQGVLLMSEENFRRLFPERVGFGYFLIEVDPRSHAR